MGAARSGRRGARRASGGRGSRAPSQYPAPAVPAPAPARDLPRLPAPNPGLSRVATTTIRRNSSSRLYFGSRFSPSARMAASNVALAPAPPSPGPGPMAAVEARTPSRLPALDACRAEPRSTALERRPPPSHAPEPSRAPPRIPPACGSRPRRNAHRGGARRRPPGRAPGRPGRREARWRPRSRVRLRPSRLRRRGRPPARRDRAPRRRLQVRSGVDSRGAPAQRFGHEHERGERERSEESRGDEQHVAPARERR